MPRCGHYLGGVGRFIVFEGGEAVGKSTQAALLADRLGPCSPASPGARLSAKPCDASCSTSRWRPCPKRKPS